MSKVIRFLSFATIALTISLGLNLSAAIADWHNNCTPIDAAVWTYKPWQRIHVRCSAPASGTTFIYFAHSAAKKYALESDRLLNLITFAIQNNKTLAIEYDPNDLSGDAIGCLNLNCRLIQGLIVQ